MATGMQELLIDKACIFPTSLAERNTLLTDNHLSFDCAKGSKGGRHRVSNTIQEPLGHLGDVISGPPLKEVNQLVAPYCLIFNLNMLGRNGSHIQPQGRGRTALVQE